jgi:epoxyqueuosine reductase QueG
MKLNENIINEIESLVANSSLNRNDKYGFSYFESPLVGFTSINNPLFSEYKKIIGDFHYHPREFFKQAHNDGTVIVWILPISSKVRKSNSKEDKYPSLFWALQREYGERLNMLLRKHIQEYMKKLGYDAVSPMLSDKWKRLDNTKVGLASTWSERHAAFASGLGTFSLSDGLITKRGIAHRCGSVITDAVLDVNKFEYDNHLSNCLFYNNKSKCGLCMSRCPAGAITESGHDKDVCSKYSYKTIKKVMGDYYKVETTGCGLCQTAVPCECSLPFKK